MGRDYEDFIRRVRELQDIGHAQALLHWDQETFLPPRGNALRARSTGTLAGIYHEKLIHPDLVNLVMRLGEVGLQGDEAVNLRELEREQSRALKLPGQLVIELGRTTSLAHEAWVEARRISDFRLFEPWLDKVVGLKREVALRVGFEGSIYDALLDEYEPGTRTEDIASLFADLRRRLIPLVERIAAAERSPAAGILDQEFPVEGQEYFGRQVMADMGFDLDAGRLDVSVHPFCSGMSPDDVRLTTRYSPDKLGESLFGIIHESGHGLYEQGLPEEAAGTPLCSSISLGIHESQSRLWENMVGRSKAFWKHYLPRLRKVFPQQLQGVGLEPFYAAVNQVEPSFIRVEADEVTYNLHILLRFELERELLEGRVPVADLPEAWNERMDSYLGIRPSNDAQGVLQDVHWSSGLLGYFPTYTLGNLYAAQFYHQARRDIPDLLDQVEEGRLAGLKAWLNEKIHARGRRVSAAELVAEVSGNPLKADYFMDYLETKFGALYKI